MKVFVSNYDDTINRTYYECNLIEVFNLKKDIENINRFIAKGNIFIVTSARTHESIKYELTRENIKYNYIISSNGLVIYDNNDNLIYANYLSKDIVDFIKNYENKAIQNLTSYKDEKGFITSKNDNVVSIEIRYLDINYIMDLVNKVKAVFKNITISLDTYKGKLYIYNKTDKKLGLDVLISKDSILNKNKNNIFSLGDSETDLNILYNYNGYAIKNSKAAYYTEPNRVVPNVRTLIKKLK